MTTANDLIQAALAAADLFREGDTPDQAEIRRLVRAADAFRSEPGPHVVDECLICAVREMTEGIPEGVRLTEPGDSVTGVVLRQGKVHSDFAFNGEDPMVPFLDLWTNEGRLRFIAYSYQARRVIAQTEPQVGDTWTVTYEGDRIVANGRFQGRLFRSYQAEVKRGHH